MTLKTSILSLLLLSLSIGQQPESKPKRVDGKARKRIAVVVSSKNPVDKLNETQLRRIFLRQKTVWPNQWPITVYERHTRNPIRSLFSIAVLGKTPEQLREYWLNLKLTRGLKAPKACRSARLVKEYLSRVKGGIGYIEERDTDDTVKVVSIIEVSVHGPSP